MLENTGKNIQSVQRAIDIINCFDANNTQLSLAEITASLGLHKSTVHGIINTLKNNGYLWQVASGKYVLGPALLSKYHFSGHSMKELLISQAKSSMEFLANKYNSTIKLYTLSDGPPNYIYHTSPINSKYQFNTDFGSVPLYSSATGKLAISIMSAERLNAYLKKNPLEQISTYTITDKNKLFAELEKIRQRNYSKEDQELLEGISAISAPIISNNMYIAAMSITGTTFHIDKNCQDIIRDLQEQTQVISENLGNQNL